MAELNLTTPIGRRRALTLGGGIAATGGVFSSVGPFASSALAHGRGDEHHDDHRHQHGELPADQIQQIVQAEGTVTKGVLSIDIERQDVGDVSGPLGVTFTPAFQVDGTLTFQPLGHGDAFFNGDIALKPEEAQGVIDAIVANGSSSRRFTSTTSRPRQTCGSSTSAVRATR